MSWKGLPHAKESVDDFPSFCNYAQRGVLRSIACSAHVFYAFTSKKENWLVNTTGRMYDEFIRLLFLHAHREASALANELPEESDQFRFLRASCFANFKGAVGLIMAKASAMRISIPLDIFSRPCIPLPRFVRSRRPTPLLAPSLVLFPPSFA